MAFVGRNLSVGMHVPFTQHQDELLFGERRIDKRERDAVKREIPRGIPGILPFVRHRNDVGVIEVRPVRIAAMEPFTRRLRHARVAFEPAIDIVVIKLFAPEQSGKGLPLHTARIIRQMARCEAAPPPTAFGVGRFLRCEECGSRRGAAQPLLARADPRNKFARSRKYG